jgi:hypothetical protein
MSDRKGRFCLLGHFASTLLLFLDHLLISLIFFFLVKIKKTSLTMRKAFAKKEVYPSPKRESVASVAARQEARLSEKQKYVDFKDKLQFRDKLQTEKARGNAASREKQKYVELESDVSADESDDFGEAVTRLLASRADIASRGPAAAVTNTLPLESSPHDVRALMHAICPGLAPLVSITPSDLLLLFQTFELDESTAKTTGAAETWMLVFGMLAVTFKTHVFVQAKHQCYTFLPTGIVAVGAPPTSDDAPMLKFRFMDVVGKAGISKEVSTPTYIDLAEQQSLSTAEVPTSKASSKKRSRDDTTTGEMIFGEGDLKDLRVLASSYAVALVKSFNRFPKFLTVFVHGYCNSNADARRRAEALSQSLNSHVIPFLWPSANSPLAYRRDLANAEFAASYLKFFILELAAEFQARNIEPPKLQLIAHSMGNYIVVRALEAFVVTPNIDLHVVSIAADVEHNDYTRVTQKVELRDVKWVSYYNPHDRVLHLSRLVNLSASSRAGLKKVEWIRSINVVQPSSCHGYVDDTFVRGDAASELRSVPVRLRNLQSTRNPFNFFLVHDDEEEEEDSSA